MTTCLRSGPGRDGFALPAALLAIMVIGVLVTAGFYASSRPGRGAAMRDLDAEAFYTAEYGLEETLAEWKNARLQGVEDERRYTSTRVLTAGTGVVGEYDIHVRRIGAQLFLVTSTGRVTAGGGPPAERRVGSMVRTVTPRVPVPAALAALDGVTAGPGATIDGGGAGDPGCALASPGAAVAVPPAAAVHADEARLVGTPPVVRAPALDLESLSAFGELDLDDLKASATKVYEAGGSARDMAATTTEDGSSGRLRCDVSFRDNWGAPDGDGPCAGEYPVIHALGDLEVGAGAGQGILIVDGDLTVGEDFDFHGVVIVQGDLEMAGSGSTVEGSVIVHGRAAVGAGPQAVETGIRYSACRIARAFDGALRPRPLAGRAWVDADAAARAGG